MNRFLSIFSLVFVVSVSAWAGSEFDPLSAVYKLRGYVMYPIHEKVWEEYPGLKEKQKSFINLAFANSGMPPKIFFKQVQESWLDKKNPLGSWSIVKRDKGGNEKVVGLIGFRDGSNKGFNYVGGMRPGENITEFYWMIAPNFDAGAQKLIKKALKHAFKKVDRLEEVWLGTFATETWKKILNVIPAESQDAIKDKYSVVAETPQELIPYQAEKAGFDLFAHYPFKPKKGKEKYIAVYKITRDEFESSRSFWNWLQGLFN